MSGPGTDPVEEFFARERGQVREQPAGPDRWEAILVESRRPRRRHVLPYVSAAAAAVVIGAVAWGTTGTGPDQSVASSSPVSQPEQTVTVTSTVTTTAPAVVPSSTTTASATRQGPLPAPATFAVTSLTGGGNGRLLALGSATCADGDPCVSVVGSDDAGATWTARATFTDQTATPTRLTPDGPGQLAGVRLADPEIGYAYGSSTFRTTDGGRTWRPYDVGGRTVLSLEVGGGTVWMVTADSCSHAQAKGGRGCSGLEVWSAPVAATRATRVQTPDLPQPVEAAWLSMDGADAYLSVSSVDPSSQVLPRRVSGTPAVLPRPAGCADTGAVWAWATANTRGALVAVCRGAKDPQGGYAVAISTDRGATWRPAVASRTLGTPGPAGVWVTAVDQQRLVAVTQGLPTSGAGQQPSTLLSSGDGGARWAPVKSTRASDRWSWAGAGGGDLVYAIGGSGGGFAVSGDRGVTFREQPFRK